jgi:hypothetical protein
VIFAAGSTPLHSATLLHFIQTVFWVWLHMLHHDIANQSTPSSLAEDALNKPDRPLPSKWISLETARKLRWAVASCCLAWSAIAYGRDMACLTVMVLILAYVYNDLGADAHWFIRDVTNASAFALFEAAACLVSSPVRPIRPTLSPLPNTVALSILLNALLYLTTNFSQDFKDVIGDSHAGRSTLPIIAPSVTRVILLPILFGWAAGLSIVWQVHLTIAFGFVGAAVAIGTRFAVLKTLVDDKISTQMYLVSL